MCICSEYVKQTKEHGYGFRIECNQCCVVVGEISWIEHFTQTVYSFTKFKNSLFFALYFVIK